MSPEERAAFVEKFKPKDRSVSARRQMTEFWKGCTGEARAARCRQITNPEAQAKSHEAQLTPEFQKRRSEWSKRMWAKYTPEERLAIAARLHEAYSRKWAEKSPEERAEITARRMKKRLATLAARRAARAAEILERKKKRETARRERKRERERAKKKAKAQRQKQRQAAVRARAAERAAAVLAWKKLREKARDSRKPILAARIDGPGRPKRFPSAAEAARYLVKVGRCENEATVKVKLCNVLHGRGKTAWGFAWRYA